MPARQRARRPRYILWFIRVPMITAVLLLCDLANPLTTAGLGLRWRTLLSDGAVGRTTVGVRTANGLLAIPNTLLAAPADSFELG